MGEPWAAGLVNPYSTLAIPIQKVITTCSKSQMIYGKKRKKRKPAKMNSSASGKNESNGFRLISS
jgi:hypothetical protein